MTRELFERDTQFAGMLSALIGSLGVALSPVPTATAPIATARAPPVRMGGYTGLPRVPPKAWALTKKWNPDGEFQEMTAMMWRDLETLYTIEGVNNIAGGGGQIQGVDYSRSTRGAQTGLTRGGTRLEDQRANMIYGICKKEPALLNPAVSNRFVFVESKRNLVEILGSEQAALSVMKQQPSLLRKGDALVGKSAAAIRAGALAAELAAALPALLFLVAAAVALPYVNEQAGLGLPIPDAAALQALLG